MVPCRLRRSGGLSPTVRTTESLLIYPCSLFKDFGRAARHVRTSPTIHRSNAWLPHARWHDAGHFKGASLVDRRRGQAGPGNAGRGTAVRNPARNPVDHRRSGYSGLPVRADSSSRGGGVHRAPRVRPVVLGPAGHHPDTPQLSAGEEAHHRVVEGTHGVKHLFTVDPQMPLSLVKV